MQRYTISLDDDLAQQFERWSEQHGYANRSEAIRDLVRDRLGKESLQDPEAVHCVTVVTLSTITASAHSVSACSKASTIATTFRSRPCTCIWIASIAWKWRYCGDT